MFGDHRLGDRGLDTFASPVGDVLVEQLRRVRAASAAQIAAIEPFAGNAFQLVEQVELRVIAGVTEFSEQEGVGRDGTESSTAAYR